MKKILNWLFYFFSLFLLIASFAVTLFILVQMNRRLEKSFMTTINVFFPFGILLVLAMINMIFNQKSVRKNLFYNLTACIIFSTIVIVGARAIFDHRLIIGTLNSYNIDFNFFANFLPFMKIMLYGLSVANILLMFHLKEKPREGKEDYRESSKENYRGSFKDNYKENDRYNFKEDRDESARSHNEEKNFEKRRKHA